MPHFEKNQLKIPNYSKLSYLKTLTICSRGMLLLTTFWKSVSRQNNVKGIFSHQCWVTHQIAVCSLFQKQGTSQIFHFMCHSNIRQSWFLKPMEIKKTFEYKIKETLEAIEIEICGHFYLNHSCKNRATFTFIWPFLGLHKARKIHLHTTSKSCH